MNGKRRERVVLPAQWLRELPVSPGRNLKNIDCFGQCFPGILYTGPSQSWGTSAL